MANTWILIAHGSAGKILSIEKSDEDVAIIKEFNHPMTAKKASQEPKEGEKAASFPTPERQAMDYSDEIENHERQTFAKEIADFLEKGRSEHQFTRLIVVASHNLLGDLRKAISVPVKRLITNELGKDLISQRLSNEELIQKIKDDLDLPNV